MMAIILAGGKGTRLKPFTMTVPKPLLPLDDIPILEVVLKQLSNAGFDRVVITLGHMAHLFVAVIGDGAKWGLRIEYCQEEVPLGTAGSLKLIKNPEDNFLVMNGDLLTTLDYRGLFNEHVASSAWGTIALHHREVKIDYGVVEVGGDGLLKNYIEKPTIPYAVSMGINVLRKECLEYVPGAEKYDMPTLMKDMRAAGRKVVCRTEDCYWQDIGRFDDYEQACADFTANPGRFVQTTQNL